jgi:hypothetical protein
VLPHRCTENLPFASGVTPATSWSRLVQLGRSESIGPVAFRYLSIALQLILEYFNKMMQFYAVQRRMLALLAARTIPTAHRATPYKSLFRMATNIPAKTKTVEASKRNVSILLTLVSGGVLLYCPVSG